MTFGIEDGVPRVGDRQFPWASKVYRHESGALTIPSALRAVPSDSDEITMVRIGFVLSFENGLALSTVWGWGSYSDNYEDYVTETPETVETAVIGERDDRGILDDVFPNVTVAEWFALFDAVSRASSDATAFAWDR